MFNAQKCVSNDDAFGMSIEATKIIKYLKEKLSLRQQWFWF